MLIKKGKLRCILKTQTSATNFSFCTTCSFFFLNRTSRALCSIFTQVSSPDVQSWSPSSPESTCWQTTFRPKLHYFLSIEATQKNVIITVWSQEKKIRKVSAECPTSVVVSLTIATKCLTCESQSQAISMKRRGRRHLICLSLGITLLDV